MCLFHVLVADFHALTLFCHYLITESNSNFFSSLLLDLLERYVDIHLSPSPTRACQVFGVSDGGWFSGVFWLGLVFVLFFGFFFNSWDAQSFYASSALKSYLTVSTGCTCKSCIPSDISHAGILPRVNPMRRAVNQARCSLFPVDTSSPSYCFQRACLTQQWCSDMDNLCTCNFDFISQGWHKIFFSSWGEKKGKRGKKRKK